MSDGVLTGIVAGSTQGETDGDADAATLGEIDADGEAEALDDGLKETDVLSNMLALGDGDCAVAEADAEVDADCDGDGLVDAVCDEDGLADGLKLTDGLAEGLGLAQMDVHTCEALKQYDGTLAMELKDREHDALKSAVLSSNLTAVDVVLVEQRLGGKEVRRVLRLKDASVSAVKGWSQHDATDVMRLPSRIKVSREVRGAKMSPRSPSVVRRLSLMSN